MHNETSTNNIIYTALTRTHARLFSNGDDLLPNTHDDYMPNPSNTRPHNRHLFFDEARQTASENA
jgi:hypothetical protein